MIVTMAFFIPTITVLIIPDSLIRVVKLVIRFPIKPVTLKICSANENVLESKEGINPKIS